MAKHAIELFNRGFAAGATGISDEDRALYVPEPIEADEIRELDAERALVVGKLLGRGRETGAEASSPIALLAVVREGRLAEARAFLSERDALEAAGA